VTEKNPPLGSVLEHGSPLKREPDLLEIGFPAGSYYLASIQDTASIGELRALARAFSGQEPAIRVIPITPEAGDAPLSLVEKKKTEHEQRHEELKQEVERHPVINEALRVFGGSITDIREA
jgi:DNA polymerase-3 subunit gamma/tau